MQISVFSFHTDRKLGIRNLCKFHMCITLIMLMGTLAIHYIACVQIAASVDLVITSAHQHRPRISASTSWCILYLLGLGALTIAARLPPLRGLTIGPSRASMEKLTARSSVELIRNPPAVRTFRNLSLRPGPYLTHSSSTEMMLIFVSTGGSTLSQNTSSRVSRPTLT